MNHRRRRRKKKHFIVHGIYAVVKVYDHRGCLAEVTFQQCDGGYNFGMDHFVYDDGIFYGLE